MTGGEIASRSMDLFRRDRLAGFAAIVLFVVICIGAFGPLLPIGDPTAVAAGPRLAPPSLSFPLGCDQLGRSLLPRVVAGILVTLRLALLAVVLTGVLGVAIGLVGAYFRGIVDIVVVRFADTLFVFPAIILGLMTASILGPGDLSVVVVIVAATLPLFVRVVRSVAIGLASREFVVAAEVAGASPTHVILVHLLPNILGPSIVQFTYAVSLGMLIESALSFLGLGTQPPYPSLGSLMQLGAAYLPIAPWLALAPGAVLASTILAVNLLGDGVRDAIDPLPIRSIK